MSLSNKHLNYHPTAVLVVMAFSLHILFAISNGAWAAVPPSKSIDTNPKSAIEAILNNDGGIDYLEAKIAIDKMIDPQADSQFVRTEVDKLEADIRRILKPNASDEDKMMVIRGYLYRAGDWNGHRPFKYDLNDPDGKSDTSRLLHYYLKTRLGNCVSMPILHAILGQRLGLDMTIAAAPNHVFVIYTDKAGRQINLEATSGGHPSRLVWYKQNLPLSDRSIQSGAFMRKFNNQEAVVVMAHDLVAHLLRQKKYDEVSNILPILAKQNPRDAQLYIQHTLLFSMKLEDEIYSKYPTEKELPPELMPKFQEYRHQEEMGLQTANELGYFGEEIKPPKEVDDFFRTATEKELEEMMLRMNARAKLKNGFPNSTSRHLTNAPILPTFQMPLPFYSTPRLPKGFVGVKTEDLPTSEDYAVKK